MLYQRVYSPWYGTHKVGWYELKTVISGADHLPIVRVGPELDPGPPGLGLPKDAAGFITPTDVGALCPPRLGTDFLSNNTNSRLVSCKKSCFYVYEIQINSFPFMPNIDDIAAYKCAEGHRSQLFEGSSTEEILIFHGATTSQIVTALLQNVNTHHPAWRLRSRQRGWDRGAAVSFRGTLYCETLNIGFVVVYLTLGGWSTPIALIGA